MLGANFQKKSVRGRKVGVSEIGSDKDTAMQLVEFTKQVVLLTTKTSKIKRYVEFVAIIGMMLIIFLSKGIHRLILAKKNWIKWRVTNLDLRMIPMSIYTIQGIEITPISLWRKITILYMPKQKPHARSRFKSKHATK